MSNHSNFKLPSEEIFNEMEKKGAAIDQGIANSMEVSLKLHPGDMGPKFRIPNRSAFPEAYPHETNRNVKFLLARKGYIENQKILMPTKLDLDEYF